MLAAKRHIFTFSTAVTVLATAAVLLYLLIWRKVQPVKGTVTSRFGNRTAPLAGASTYHTGTDIAVPVGTKVRSPWSGKVTSVYSNASGGKQMVITHHNGYTTGYAHLSEWKKQEGDRVMAGTVVALSGNTGNTTGPHLHFTLRDRKGNRIDPERKFNFK